MNTANITEPWLLENDFEFPEGGYGHIRLQPAKWEHSEAGTLVPAVGYIMFDNLVVQTEATFCVSRSDGVIVNRLRYVREPGSGVVDVTYRLPVDDDDEEEDGGGGGRRRRRKKRTVCKYGLPATAAVSFSSTNPLNAYQEDIIAECLVKKSGAISVPMGNGKTLTFLMLGQMQAQNLPIVVVCSKTLTVSWETEIDKFFQTRLPYTVLSGDKKQRNAWTLDPLVRVVIVTPDLLSKVYNDYGIESQYTVSELMMGVITNRIYHRTIGPWLKGINKGAGVFYSQQWGCLAVDEAQDHTNSSTTKCRSIGALASHHRWLLSGTMFNEPPCERILGFSLLLNLDRPRSLPGTADLIRSRTWGIKPYMVERGHNPDIKLPSYKERVVSHSLDQEETIVYQSLRLVMREIKTHVDRLRREGDTANARRFSQYQLALVTYLRQALMCPIVPIASVCVDMADYKGKSHLSRVMLRELQRHNLAEWLDNEESVKSSRIRAIVAELAKHANDKVVLFGAFRSCLNVLMRYIDPAVYTIFTITSDMNRHQRAGVLENFRNVRSGVLVMSYSIGAVGLNLQCANVVFLTDMMWNYGTTSQAIARVFRAWQINDVQVVFFTSNTGIERAILEKQLAKLKVITELYHGNIQTKVPKLVMNDVLRIIDQDETVGMVDSVRGFKSTDHMKTELADMLNNRSVAEIEAAQLQAQKLERAKARALDTIHRQFTHNIEIMDIDETPPPSPVDQQAREAEIMREEREVCQKVRPDSKSRHYFII